MSRKSVNHNASARILAPFILWVWERTVQGTNRRLIRRNGVGRVMLRKLSCRGRLDFAKETSSERTRRRPNQQWRVIEPISSWPSDSRAPLSSATAKCSLHQDCMTRIVNTAESCLLFLVTLNCPTCRRAKSSRESLSPAKSPMTNFEVFRECSRTCIPWRQASRARTIPRSKACLRVSLHRTSRNQGPWSQHQFRLPLPSENFECTGSAVISIGS